MRRFAFRLAGHLGCTVRELLQRIDSAELSEWLAYDRLDPLPDPHWSAAMQAAVMSNLLGSGRRAWKPDDFLPKRRKPKAQSPRDHLAILDKIAATQARAGS